MPDDGDLVAPALLQRLGEAALLAARRQRLALDQRRRLAVPVFGNARGRLAGAQPGAVGRAASRGLWNRPLTPPLGRCTPTAPCRHCCRPSAVSGRSSSRATQSPSRGAASAWRITYSLIVASSSSRLHRLLTSPGCA